MSIISKIKSYVNNFRQKQSFKDRFKLFAVKVSSFFTTSRKCTRCNGNGYIEKWKNYQSRNPKFIKEYNKSTFGVCFICRGGGLEWKINHTVKPFESLDSICKKYNLVNDRNHNPKLYSVIAWNPKLRSQNNNVKTDDNILLWIDFHILAIYKTRMIPTRLKNGYFQIKNNANSSWEWFHRNIVKHILGNIPDGFQVHHIDHNKLNNNPDNLVPLPTDLHQDYHRLVNEKLIDREEILKNINENG